jgi:hypothetical protein
MTPDPASGSGNPPAALMRNRSLWVIAVLLAFPSVGFVQKYTGLGGVAVYVVAAISLIFLTVGLTRRFSPLLNRHFKGLAILSITGLTVAFVALHPFEDSRGPGKSSDRDEGLEMATGLLAKGETPYYPSNRTAGPLSLLPGSIFLAAPFVAIGKVGLQNVFWLAVFLIAAAAYFRDKAFALWALAVPLAVSEAALYEFISGGDLIANGIYVAVFFLLAMNRWEDPRIPAWQRWLACVLVGVGLASRANFLLLLPVFGAALWRTAGWRVAVGAGLLTTLTTAAITLPFYLNDPEGFSPLLSRGKLGFVDESLPWAGTSIIGLAILVSCLAALWLLLRRGTDHKEVFFRCCTVITITPLIGAVLLSSWIAGAPDFGITSDRFGLMYVCFALLGWGKAVSTFRA